MTFPICRSTMTREAATKFFLNPCLTTEGGPMNPAINLHAQGTTKPKAIKATKVRPKSSQVVQKHVHETGEDQPFPSVLAVQPSVL